jgi:hypothetical protein
MAMLVVTLAATLAVMAVLHSCAPSVGLLAITNHQQMASIR